MEKKYRLSLDPGQKTGVALWDNDSWGKECRPVLVELWNAARSSGEWHNRCAILGGFLDRTLRAYRITNIYCELPMFFESTTGMMVSARGDLVKLCYLVGMYAGIAESRNVYFEPVPVIEWKGQLPKEIVKQRIIKKFGVTNCGNYRADIWDAIGIGLFKKGYFE